MKLTCLPLLLLPAFYMAATASNININGCTTTYPLHIAASATTPAHAANYTNPKSCQVYQEGSAGSIGVSVALVSCGLIAGGIWAF